MTCPKKNGMTTPIPTTSRTIPTTGEANPMRIEMSDRLYRVKPNEAYQRRMQMDGVAIYNEIYDAIDKVSELEKRIFKLERLLNKSQP